MDSSRRIQLCVQKLCLSEVCIRLKLYAGE